MEAQNVYLLYTINKFQKRGLRKWTGKQKYSKHTNLNMKKMFTKNSKPSEKEQHALCFIINKRQVIIVTYI